jgi:hypothetical protein
MNKSAPAWHWMKVRGQHHARPFGPAKQRTPSMHFGGAGSTPVLCNCLLSEHGQPARINHNSEEREEMLK